MGKLLKQSIAITCCVGMILSGSTFSALAGNTSDEKSNVKSSIEVENTSIEVEEEDTQLTDDMNTNNDKSSVEIEDESQSTNRQITIETDSNKDDDKSDETSIEISDDNDIEMRPTLLGAPDDDDDEPDIDVSGLSYDFYVGSSEGSSVLTANGEDGLIPTCTTLLNSLTISSETNMFYIVDYVEDEDTEEIIDGLYVPFIMEEDETVGGYMSDYLVQNGSSAMIDCGKESDGDIVCTGRFKITNENGKYVVTEVDDSPYIIEYDAAGGQFSNGSDKAYGFIYPDELYMTSVEDPDSDIAVFSYWQAASGAMVADWYEFQQADISNNKITLTAVWNEVPSGKVTYNANGGRFADNATTHEEKYPKVDGRHYSIDELPEEPTNGNQNFIGWYTKNTYPATDGAWLTLTSSANHVDDETYYAIWSDSDVIEVIYVTPNGNETKVKGVSPYQVGDNFDVNALLGADYMFKGYYKDEALSEPYGDGETITASGTHVYIKALSFGVLNYTNPDFIDDYVKDSEGEEFFPDDVGVVLGYSLSEQSAFEDDLRTYFADDDNVSFAWELPTLTAPNSGYVFDGWLWDGTDNEESSGDIMYVDPFTEDTVITSPYTILTSKWKEIEAADIVITFDAGEGIVIGDSSVTIKVGESLGNKLPSAECPNSVFRCWQDENGGVVDSSTIFNSDTTVVAVYDKEGVPVTFDANGGEFEDTSFGGTMNVPHDSAIGTLPSVSRNGYSFDGWFTSQTGGEAISEATVISAPVTYYAHWTEVESNVESAWFYLSDDAEKKSVTALNVEYGDALPLALAYSPENAGNAQFVWSSSNDSVIKVENNQLSYGGEAGEATLTATTVDGSVESLPCVITVTKSVIVVNSLKFREKEVTVYKDDTLSLAYDFEPADAVNASFIWETSDDTIVAVDATDGVTGINGCGDVTITIRTEDDTMRDTCLVHVIDREDEDQYWTITFEVEGGESMQPMVVRKGASATLSDAVREGWTFDGWHTLNGTKVSGSYTPIEDTVLFAYWVKDEDDQHLGCTITFVPQNGGESIVWENFETNHKLGTLPKVFRTGFTLDGWYTLAVGGEKATPDDIITDDMTYYAHWTEKPVDPDDDPEPGPDPGPDPGPEVTDQYALTLDANGGKFVSGTAVLTPSQRLETGKDYWNDVSSVIPSRNGFAFNGYYDAPEGGNLVYGVDGVAQNGDYFSDGIYTPQADLRVYAQWVKNVVEYTLSFDSNGGSNISAVKYAENSVVSVFPTPVRDGFNFDGWFTAKTGGDKVTSLTMDADKKVYAHWTKEESGEDTPVMYTLSYDTNGGVAIDSVQGEAGTRIVDFPIAVRDGFNFEGWFTKAEGGSRVSAVTLTSDKTIYAHWSEENASTVTYVVTLDYQYDDKTSKYEVEDGMVFSAFPVSPVREGYEFDGWFTEKTGGEKVTQAIVTGDVTYYAQWHESEVSPDPQPEMKKITYDLNGGSLDGQTGMVTIDVEEGSTIILPKPEKDGFEFDYWEGSRYEAGDEYLVVEDHTLKAIWKEKADVEVHVVTLDYQFDDNKDTFNVNDGETFDEFPTEIVRDGYDFKGWFTEATEGDEVSEAVITSDVTFYAHWSEKSEPEKTTCVVTLDYQHDDKVGTYEVEKDSLFGEFPTEVIRTGYIFDGWFTDAVAGDKVTGDVVVTDDVTYYAHWTEDVHPEPRTWTVTLDYQYDDITVSSEIADGEIFKDFPMASRDGYDFEGWFTEPTEGDELSEALITSDVTFYAHWIQKSEPEKKMYKLTLDYQYDGKSSVYDIEEGEIFASFPTDVQRSGYRFVGWFDAKDGGAPVTFVTMDADKTVYAHWLEVPDDSTVAEYTVTLDYQAGNKKDTFKVKEGTEFAGFTKPSVAGYTFLGWYDASVGGNKVVSHVVTGDVTFYAHWKANDGSDSKPSDDDNPVVPDNDDNENSNNGKNNGNNGGSNGSSNNGSNGTNNNSSSNSSTNADGTSTVARFTLNITSASGTKQKVTVNRDVTLKALAIKLGYNDVAKWTVRQAKVSEYEISGDTTIGELASLLKNGDLLIIAYDSNGKAIGSAKVVKVTDSEMDVTLSKDTNVALRSAEEIGENGTVSKDGKGEKSETSASNPSEPDSNPGTGKENASTQEIKTGDTFGYIVYGILGSMLVLCGAIYLVLKRRRELL